MTITTLVTQIEPAEPGDLAAAVEPPFALAAAHGAHLTLLLFPTEVALVEASVPGWELREREARAAAWLREAAERRGIACEIRERSSFAYGVGEVLADHLRVADLGLLTLRENAGAGQRMLVSAALFDSGRPVLLAPRGAAAPAPPERVIVAWDATPAAVRAVHGALPFIRAAAETRVVSVADDKPLGRGESGVELTKLLARHGARAAFHLVPRAGRSVLEALAGEAAGAAAPLLVLGALRHSPLYNLAFGSVTKEVMESGPPLPALLAA